MQIKDLKFHSQFLWGVATSSFQTEGGVNADGRGDSIWDTFCRLPGKILDHSNGDTATGHYYKWKEDIALMAQIGIKAFRFSVAWSRILPNGKGQPNEKGISFYEHLIDELIDKGIEPVITLYHWDLPQALENIGGWLSRETAFAFAEFSRIVFHRFRHRVKLWITINEPWVVSELGYKHGIHAPGLSDSHSAVIAAHHLLLAHGLAVQEMKALFLPQFSYKIGISLNLSVVEPENPLKEIDCLAAKKHGEFLNDFFLNALFKGHYSDEILNKYSNFIEQNDLYKISEPVDFLGINYYTRTVIRGVNIENEIVGVVINFPNEHSTLWEFYPNGLKEVIESVWKNYQPKEIIITENGTALDDIILSEKIDDQKRIEYMKAHLIVIHDLIESSIPVNGYFAWSFIDNFEWTYGYTKRFGLVYVDFHSLKRFVKKSAYWYGEIIKNNSLNIEGTVRL